VADFKKILVPFDGSPPAVKALKKAISIAQKFKSKVDVLFVREHVQFSGALTETLFLVEQETKQLEELTLKKADYILKKHKFKKAKVMAKEGHPADTILSTAKRGKYDLVVMGNRGLSDVDRFFLGSVTDNVVHHVHCTVLVVK